MDDKILDISTKMKVHYSQTFQEHGPNARGVDWGKEEDVHLRYGKMLAVSRYSEDDSYTLLDVGCGYGGLLQYAREHGKAIQYTGIDLCESMIEFGREKFSHATFLCQDIMEYQTEKQFDYVVCNGILTQKLTASILDMDYFARQLIRKMYHLSKKGIAFNVMTNKVNFMVSNLYYKSPVEMVNFCMEEVSTKIILDHAYPLYEYTIYLYH